MSSSWFFRGLLLLVVGLTAGVLWSNDIPLGVPGEWVWSRRDRNAELALALLLGIVTGAVYCGWAWWGAARIGVGGTARRCVWVAGLFCATVGLWWSLLGWIPGVTGIVRIPWVLYFPGSSGYFTQARQDVADPREFLRTYQQRVTEATGMDRYLHLGTHPPGLTLAFHGLRSLCGASPPLVRLVEVTEPAAVREAFQAIHSTAPPGAGPTPTDCAAIWLGWLLVLGGAALGGPALYGLARRRLPPAAAWRIATLWPLVPAILVFLPKSDALFGGLAAVLAWLWFRSVDRNSWTTALLFGFVLYGCLLLSLAFLPVALLIAVASLVELFEESVDPHALERGSDPLLIRGGAVSRLAATAQCVGVALAGFAIPLAALWGWAGYNTAGVALQNLRNHAEFYQHSPRTYLPWLGVNAAELALAAGLPLSLAGLASLISGSRIRQLARSQLMAFVVVWGILWLSGKNMGEAARLWCFLLAWPTFLAGMAFAATDAPDQDRARRDWIWLLGTQMLACVVTVFVVTGFEFGLVQ